MKNVAEFYFNLIHLFAEVATDPFEDLCDLFKNQAFSPIQTPTVNSSLFTKVWMVSYLLYNGNSKSFVGHNIISWYS